ncbi:MAG: DEAD/DEAH box helicase family protein [Bacillota bacterium]
MKLKFKNQDFQNQAVDSVCNLFLGQEKNDTVFSVGSDVQMGMFHGELGIGNQICISDEQILQNMNDVQRANGLPLTHDLEGNNFCVEMETGTGKTFVYIKTIYELNKKYGFTKFVIVVPSVAIREGAVKSLNVTAEYFANEYNNVPISFFVYHSSKLSSLRSFASGNTIQVMIINIDSFNKDDNIINRDESEKVGGEAPMRYIADSRPVVIIDEPQSVDGTDKAKEAMARLNALFTLRYSATHKDKLNLLYRLTPVDAYRIGLVKQIVVSSNRIENDFNKPYVKLLSVSSSGGFKAKIELDIKNAEGIVSRKIKTVKQGDDLFILSGERDIYEGYQVVGIDCTPKMESVEFQNTEVVMLEKSIGEYDENLLKEAQIKRTIEAHLDKELMYHDKGIKVLSLFFIDEVKKYRTVDGEKGIYAEMFERLYPLVLARPKYDTIREKFNPDIEKAHNGYFSQDKSGKLKNTKGDTVADESTYNTIMRDKEWLLSFDCPLRFIWSHSALKEGWDNPNVFQVCTLIEQKTEFTCRQKIGRGLRLCVNQDGERIEDKNINVLHVMANESFAEFSSTLQREIEKETGVKFGVLESHIFTGIVYHAPVQTQKVVDEAKATAAIEYLMSAGVIDSALKPTAKAVEIMEDETKSLPVEVFIAKESLQKAISENQSVSSEEMIGTQYVEITTQETTITEEESKEIFQHLKEKNYISANGKVKDTMKYDLANGTLDLPKKFEMVRKKIENLAVSANTKPMVRNAQNEVVVKLKKQVLISEEFQDLWSRIKQKTTYRVAIDSEKLVELCIKEIKEMPAITKAKLINQTADINIENMGVSHNERAIRTEEIQSSYDKLPHIINIINEESLIKRETVRRILVESGRLKEFLINPQSYLENVQKIIRKTRHNLAIDGISYIKLDGEEYYVQEIFDSTEILANLERNAVEVKNSVYDYVVYDSSTVEKPFAVALDSDPEVKMFFKIPARFKIKTPIGSYNPDWAVYMNKDEGEKLYFVLETKGSTDSDDLRGKENARIHCGKAHFEALNNNSELRLAKSWNEFKVKM